MNELVLAHRAPDWRRLKALVLDSVSSSKGDGGLRFVEREPGARRGPHLLSQRSRLRLTVRALATFR